MSEAKYLELIQRELDGLNSPQQSADLHALMEKNAALHKSYEELRTVVDALEQAEMHEPPAHLKATIMNALPRAKQQPEQTKASRSWLAGLLPRQPRFQISFAFAGGLALGLLLFALFTGSELGQNQPDASQLFGTLASSTQSGQPVAVDLGSTKGTLVVQKSQKGMTIVLDFVADEAVDFVLEFDPERLKFEAILNDGAAPESIQVVAGNMTFRPQNGVKSRISFVTLNESPSPQLRFKIVENGNIRYETSLPKTP